MQECVKPPPTLRELQRWMAALILDPQRLETSSPEAITSLDREAALQRLHVYADGYPARIEESLAENFPALAHLTGAAAFHALTHRYLHAVVLPSYNLNDAGAALAAFLRADPLAAGLPFLSDLAELEWRVARAFHAAALPPLDPTRLTAWSADDWEHAVLRFQPAVALVSSAWPIRELWECQGTPIEAIDVDLNGRPDHVLVYRAGFAVHCLSLPAPEARALRDALAGRHLGELVERLAADDDDPDRVAAWFARWMQLGIVVDCVPA